MNNFNFAAIEGNLVKAPEIRTINGGSRFCMFTVGCNHSYPGKDGKSVDSASFLDVKVWNSLADTCAKYLGKGSRVLVSGKLRKDTWRNADGEYRSATYILGEEVKFLSRGHAASAEQQPVPPTTAKGEQIPF